MQNGEKNDGSKSKVPFQGMKNVFIQDGKILIEIDRPVLRQNNAIDFDSLKAEFMQKVSQD